MDAATRAELEDLRRRAYGPDADLDGDPIAVARLIELEEFARGSSAPQPASPAPDPSPPPSQDDRPAVPAPRPVTRRIPAILGFGAAAAAAIVVAVTLTPTIRSAAPAPSPTPAETAGAVETGFIYTADPHSEELFTLRIDGSFSDFVDRPADGDSPDFPAAAPVEWVTPLGDYYGWELWAAGGSGDPRDEHCLLLRRGDDTRSRCATLEDQRAGILRVSLAAEDVSVEEQPQPMRGDHRIRFWWVDDGAIRVVLGSFGRDG